MCEHAGGWVAREFWVAGPGRMCLGVARWVGSVCVFGAECVVVGGRAHLRSQTLVCAGCCTLPTVCSGVPHTHLPHWHERTPATHHPTQRKRKPITAPTTARCSGLWRQPAHHGWAGGGR